MPASSSDIGNTITVTVPGRINIIGEHTDYNGGMALPAATHLTMTMYFEQQPHSEWSIHALDSDEHFLLRADSAPAVTFHWARFFIEIWNYAQHHHLPRGGMHLSFTSDIPIGAGMSSSSALVCALVAGTNRLFGWALSTAACIHLASRVEHGYGVRGGLLDQMALFLSRAGHALFIDFSDESHRHITLPQWPYQWVVWDSMERRQLLHSPFNQKRETTERALQVLGATRWKEVTREAIDTTQGLTDEMRKMGHFILEENQRVLHMVHAIENTDISKIGALLRASHRGLRDQYGVSSPGLNYLADRLNQHPACVGARMMGGGFGGMVLSLVEENAIPALVDHLRRHSPYRNLAGKFHYTISPGEGLSILEGL